MALPSRTSRNWCWTLNNPEEFDIDEFPEDSAGPLGEILATVSKLSYTIYQYEIGESGTLHFQGYSEFKAPVRFSALRHGDLQFAHFEVRRGTAREAGDYCSKLEGRIAGPWTFGESSSGQGSRSDLKEAAAALLATRSLRELAVQYPATYVQYHSGFAKLLETTTSVPEQLEPTWRPWQTDALGLLDGPPHPRKVYWFVDFDGGLGKSFLVRYLATNRGALPLSSGRHDRLLNAWQGEPIVTFDFARDVSSGGESSDRTPYAVIESIKNGIVFSGMFGARPKIFPVPHVLCFSNFEPDETKLSADRWDITVLRTPPA